MYLYSGDSDAAGSWNRLAERTMPQGVVTFWWRDRSMPTMESPSSHCGPPTEAHANRLHWCCPPPLSAHWAGSTSPGSSADTHTLTRYHTLWQQVQHWDTQSGRGWMEDDPVELGCTYSLPHTRLCLCVHVCVVGMCHCMAMRVHRHARTHIMMTLMCDSTLNIGISFIC